MTFLDFLCGKRVFSRTNLCSLASSSRRVPLSLVSLDQTCQQLHASSRGHLYRFRIPIALDDKDIYPIDFVDCLIPFLVEEFNAVIIVFTCWSVDLYNRHVEWLTFDTDHYNSR